MGLIIQSILELVSPLQTSYTTLSCVQVLCDNQLLIVLDRMIIINIIKFINMIIMIVIMVRLIKLIIIMLVIIIITLANI